MHLPLSGSNYRIGLKLLDNRYANKHLILHVQLQRILNLPKFQNESAEQLRKLLIAFDENLMALTALDIETETSDFIRVQILAEKTDLISRRQWELDSSEDKNRTVTQMRKFINLSVRAPEAANYFKDSNSKERAEKHSKASNYRQKDPKCSNCSKGHPLFRCESFLEMTPTQQAEVI